MPLDFDSQKTDEDMKAYPYHCAVQFTKGDLEPFGASVKYNGQEGGGIKEKFPMYVCPTRTEDTSSNEGDSGGIGLDVRLVFGHRGDSQVVFGSNRRGEKREKLLDDHAST
ncbi:hypothetical protein GN244_ATG10842 [Phytophthora infestans]|uniref:Uncharacterized protein n=1 Tax=Phytophthora infestans TaxID=4787 RepID=A0A833WC63_PHYIN|nr:hypothetical protein GN244_ATG10842 [Phytophthora infestans]KAF4146936.1 hypothetical protein GN958_ATG03823 [Phytophthora infestans]